MSASRAPVYAVYSGAVGWTHDAWPGRFYPADLPDEWQLAYYSNHFRCVYLPHAVWAAHDPSTLAGWAEEVVPGFLFLLEGSAMPDLGPAFVPVAGREDPRITWFEADSDLKDIAATLRHPEVAGPRYLVSRDAGLKRLQEISNLLIALGL